MYPEAGYLHVLNGASRSNYRLPPLMIRSSQRSPTTCNWSKLASLYCDAVKQTDLDRLAASLTLEAWTLRRMSIGRMPNGAWAFPMRNADRAIIGIRTRYADGHKESVVGSRSGLFMALDQDLCDPLLIAEGPTDTAALLELGFDAVGRPSCHGGGEYLESMVIKRRIVIIADDDVPGWTGANALATRLHRRCTSVKVVTPPYCKDAREWRKNGASRTELELVIESTTVFQGT
jgi:hypothetical protein